MVFRERHVIDFFKGMTLPAILLLMTYYQRFDNCTLWIYAATHGSYGLLWCLKSHFFPDSQWERPLTPFVATKLTVGLTAYWLAPWIIAVNDVDHKPPYLFCCVFLYSLGVFLHFASDMQKTVSLQLKPGHLITTGLWSYSRNPNYVGEFLIYSSFSLMSAHPLPAGCFLCIILSEWVPNMLKKDKSLARYPEFTAYSERSGLFIPKKLI